jgi:hypothetical protein
MDESLLAWTAAIESGFARPAEWVAWAERQIVRLDEPPVWVLDLSLAHSAKEALEVLWPARASVAQVIWGRLDWNGMYLGFLFLRFERGDLGMLDLLTQAGQKADCANYRIGCETFYLLANEIDGGGPTRPNNLPLEQRVAGVFRPLTDAARGAWFGLNNEEAEQGRCSRPATRLTAPQSSSVPPA